MEDDMKLLVYNWVFVTKYDMYQAFDKQGIEYDLFTPKALPRIKSQAEQFKEELDKFLERKGYDAFFSVNFFPELAEAAHDRDTPYVSWAYDSPSLGGVMPCLFYDTNHIFLFDSWEYEEYKGHGVPHLYYMPLATNASRTIRMRPTPMEQMKYHADVSFVGRLYQADMDKTYPLFDEYGAGYIAAVINTQLRIYGTNIIKDMINENVVKRICNKDVSDALVENMNKEYLADVSELDEVRLIGFLLRAVTNKERVMLISLLAKYFNVKLFTSEPNKLPNVTVHGSVDYVNEMPKVFKCSKINLNITVRSIRNAIPQRVFDIMGCGGLVLTNYQEDLQRYFEDGCNILVYSSIDEALDKCRYYLSHEKEADQIRQNGYKLVRDQFSYEHQLNQIWEISDLKSKLGN
jgi:spore maturation protein CgeB